MGKDLVKLTATKIKSLRRAGKYPDGNGLFLQLSSKGKGSWVLRAQKDKVRRDFGLGSLTNVSLAEARK